MIMRRLCAAVLIALAALTPGAALARPAEPYTVRLPDDIWGAKLPLPEDASGPMSPVGDKRLFPHTFGDDRTEVGSRR